MYLTASKHRIRADKSSQRDGEKEKNRPELNLDALGLLLVQVYVSPAPVVLDGLFGVVRRVADRPRIATRV